MLIKKTTQVATPVHNRTSVRLAAALLSFAVVAGCGAFTATAASAAEVAPATIVLGVGSTEAQRIITWYSATDTTQMAQLALASNVVDGAFPTTNTNFAATGGATTSGAFSRNATLTGLKENTSYVYRVGTEGNWSANYTFKTQSFSGDFNFLFFGDPQLGSSGNVTSDAAGWVDTLNVATATYPNAEMLFSAGDQVETAANEAQYTAFLQSDKLRQIPFVSTIGNHDVGSKAYLQHFTQPNITTTAGPASSGTTSGGDYWFIYKDVLFMDINSNSLNDASHIAWMTQIVAEHGAQAKWKVLAFHHSIYSSGPHATDTDVNTRRTDLPTTISNLGVDLVLQGHDHSYARTYLLKNGEIANPAEAAGADSVVAGPGGVLYVTSNSASGSKYYDLNPAAPSYKYLSVANQEKVRNYTAVEVTAGAITVKTLRSQANGAEKPVNSVVDSVSLSRAADVSADSQEVQVTVPATATEEFTWSVDGTNALVNLGTAVESGDHFAATGTINPIRVTDTRTTASAWSISAQISDFTAGGASFSGRYLGWTPLVTDAGGGAVAGAKVGSGFDTSGKGLSASSTLGYAATGHTTGTAKLGAGLDLKIPVDATNGTYKAQLTLTALS